MLSNLICVGRDFDDTAMKAQRRTMEAAMIDVTRASAMIGRPEAAWPTADV